jgi:hypothetical protein
VLNWKMTLAPTVKSNDFLYQSGPRKISIAFNQDVSASLTASDLVVHNVTTDTDVTTGVLNYDPATNIATWTFSSLPSGNYHASLAAGSVSNSSLNLLAQPTGLDFFWLNGDADHDRTVGFADLVAVAQHYNQTGGATLANGDMDGDGNVGFADLVAVAQNYNKTLAALPGAVPAPAGAVLSPSEQAAVLATLPAGPAKSFAQQLVGQSTMPTKPTKPAPITATKPAPITAAKPEPVVAAKPSIVTTKVTSTPVAAAVVSTPAPVAISKPAPVAKPTAAKTTAAPVPVTASAVVRPTTTAFCTTRISNVDKKENSVLL